ncbi:uncharacterized protein LOC143300484 [Babylonia areolata]|uniref:uncharacterized protein LOC143300484 n=1 Tax=Babylonia areolata TaxID=304850 RepID=UPI003FD2A90A
MAAAAGTSTTTTSTTTSSTTTTRKLSLALLLTLTSNATLLCILLRAGTDPPLYSSSSSSSSSDSSDYSSSSIIAIADPAATTATNRNGDDENLWTNIPKSKFRSQLLHRGGVSVNSDKSVTSAGESVQTVQSGFVFFKNDDIVRFGGNGARGGVVARKSPERGEWRRKEKEEEEEEGRERLRRVPRRVRSTLQRIDTGHHLDDVIAALTESELESLDDNTVKILIPALIGLESVVLRDLERLHDVSVHQELRLERLEKSRLQQQEIIEAANVIREEEYLLQRQKQKEALRKQEEEEAKNTQDTGTTTPPPPQDATTTVIDFDEAENVTATELEVGADGSGSGEESVVIATAAVSTSAPSSAVNKTESSDSAIINHIYEIYSSLTSMEHKVMELGSSLTMVSSELYRQRSALVGVEDKVEELRRAQRTLAMRSTMHGFKLTDLEQFRGQAELLMQTASTALEQFEGKLEVFKDRVTEQQDEVQLMRNVFGGLEQSNNELRAADAYKAHDIQELKRGAQQVETRLNNLYHTLDRYVGNIRWDVKTYLDHVCDSNHLVC